MRRILLSIFIIFGITLFAKDISGKNIKNSITLDNITLKLNGAGIRSKFIFDVYIGALYLKDSSSNAKMIISSHSPMDIRMIIISSLVTSSKMKEGFSDDFKALESIGYKVKKQELQKFLTAFDEDIVKNDIFDFAYLPKEGLVVYKNGKKIVTIDDFEFKKALYAIWFSEKPAQKSLKNKMLGK